MQMTTGFTVAAYLSSEFENVADSLLERATGGTSHDSGSTGQETARYDKLMKSLRLVGVCDAPNVFEKVWQWRSISMKKARGISGSQNKEVVIESTFFEASVQLLEDKPYSCEEVLRDHTADMEAFAFRWAMSVEQVQTFFGMTQFRRNIQNAVPRIIGALARGRLEAVSALLFKEISTKERADIGVRSELLSLCDAMKCIKLSFATNDLFAASLNLIQHADPLKHNAPVKKSQVRHSLSSMMYCWLHPLVQTGDVDLSNISSEHVNRWYEQIDSMQERLRGWAEEKSKHYMDGFPLIVDLWCLQQERSFVERGDKVIKMLKKALKLKEYRCLAVKCLTQCARVALSRVGNSKQVQLKAQVEDWLRSTVTDVLQTIKKGPAPSAELHDLMIRLCVTVGRHRPLFITDSIILPLIQNEQLEKITISLRAILEMMFMEIAQMTATASDDDNGLRRMMVSLETNSLEYPLLEYIRTGSSAMCLLKLDERKAHFSKEIEKLLKTFDSSFGGVGATAYRNSMSDNTKDSSLGLNVMAWTIRTIPYILPEGFSTDKLVSHLARYTGHVDAMISNVAFRSLKNVMVGMPKTRNAVVQGLAFSCLKISEDNREGILNGLRNLEILLLDWLSLANESVEEGPSHGRDFGVASLEGKLLVFLCSVEPSVRRLTFNILAIVRRLDQALNESQTVHPMHPTRGGSMSQSASPSSPYGENGAGTSVSPFGMTVYVIDVLEEMGVDIAQKVYWDFGPCSDVDRRWKPFPENISLPDVLFATMDGKDAPIRLSRCLSSIAVHASALCIDAFEQAYIYITHKLSQLIRIDTTGRTASFSDVAEQVPHELLRNYCCFASGCPPFKNIQRLKKDAYSAAKLHQVLLNMMSVGSSSYQRIAVMALGNCNPASYEILASQIQVEMTQDQLKEKSRGKQTTRSKMEEMRTNTANVFRIVADHMPRGTLRYRNHLRLRLLEFIERTRRIINELGTGSLFEHISQQTTDYAAQDLLQLCYCLCSVAANAGPELTSLPAQDGLRVEFRRKFFSDLQLWNSSGDDPGEFIKRKHAMQHAVLARLKDAESMERVVEVEKSCLGLEVASRLAMVAMLQGPPWDSDRRTNNPIFTWVDFLLKQPKTRDLIGPSNESIARQALTKLIISNMSLFDSYVNKCYHEEQQVSSVYFQVVCEVYCSYEVNIDVHVILSLVLYKCVDSDPQVREDALHLLKCLSHREWGGKCTTGWALWFSGNSIEDDVIVIGRLQDTCQSFQYQLSESLAREHPEVNKQLCEELMTRQCNDVVNPAVLICLTPWMEQLSFSHGDYQSIERLLKSMYYVTSQHGKRFTHEIERLWSTIASKGNIRPILTFLVKFAVDECTLQDTELLAQYYSVMKRISLYLARTNAHRTIDHLVSEAARMMQASPVVSMEGESCTRTAPLKFSSSSARLNRRQDGSASSQLEMTRSAEMSVGGGTRQRPPSFTMTPMHHRERTYTSNVSVSMQSDGSFDEASKSEAQTLPNSKTSVSNFSALGGGVRRGSEVVPPVLKGLIQRADVAVCMLAEIAYEHGEEFSDHVPVLFHLCVVSMDSLDPVVRLHCQQLVINLLNVLLSRRVGVPGKANKLSALVSALQSMKGQAPWPYEDTNLSEGQVLSEDDVSFFVSGLLEATSDGSNLKDLWIKEALSWSVESCNRHLSCRSFQVLRGLAPTASSEAFIGLVRCLRECFVNPSLTAMECVLEILETMKMLMYNVEASKLVLYPQLFWVCISLLSSDYVHIYRLALEILHCLLGSLKISNDIILNVLLATTPESVDSVPVLPSSISVIQEEEMTSKAEPKEIGLWELGTKILLPAAKRKDLAVHCIQHLLIKGLYLEQTESVTVQLLSRLAAELVLTPEVTLDSCSYLDDMCPKKGEHSGVSLLLGPVHVQIGVSLASVVSWTCQKILSGAYMHGPWEVCNSLAEACISERYNTVGTTLADLTSAESKSLPLILTRLADALCDELPSQVLSLIIGYWLGLLRNKEHSCTQISFMLLRSVFERCKNPNSLELVNLQALRVVLDFNVFSLISSHLQGSNAVEASEVLSAMVACSSICDKQQDEMDQEQSLFLSHAMEIGMGLHHLVPADNAHVEKTITGVLSTCPQHLRKPSGKDFMPFLKEHQG